MAGIILSVCIWILLLTEIYVPRFYIELGIVFAAGFIGYVIGEWKATRDAAEKRR